jgi:hypothetical protein
MNKIVLKSFAIFMSLLVLLSSAGFGVREHTCQVRGKTVSLSGFVNDKGCKACKVKHSPRVEARSPSGVFIDKVPCCKEKVTFERVEVVNTVVSAAPVFLFLAAVLPPAPSFLFSFLPKEIQYPFGTVAPYSFSSRLSGRSLLALIQSYLI